MRTTLVRAWRPAAGSSRRAWGGGCAGALVGDATKQAEAGWILAAVFTRALQTVASPRVLGAAASALLQASGGCGGAGGGVGRTRTSGGRTSRSSGPCSRASPRRARPAPQPVEDPSGGREAGDELKRIARHPGKYIKTSVWNKGMPQRLPTLDFCHGLTNEFNALKAVVFDLK